VQQTALESKDTATVLRTLWEGEKHLMGKVLAKYKTQTAQTTQARVEIEELSKNCIERVEKSQHELHHMSQSLEDTQNELIERQVEIQNLKKRLHSAADENERLAAIASNYIDGDEQVEFSDNNQQANAIDDNEKIIGEISNVLENAFQNLDEEATKKEMLLDNLSKALENLEMKYMGTMNLLSTSIKTASIGCQAEMENEDEDQDPPPKMPIPRPVKGSNVPMEMRKMMTHFPYARCLASEGQVLQTIMEFYLEKAANDRIMDSREQDRVAAPQFLFRLLSKKYCLPALVDMHVTQFLESLLRFGKHRRVQLFVGFIGLEKPDDPPPSPGSDLVFLLDVLDQFQTEGHLSTEIVAACNSSGVIKIPRSAAIAITRDKLFPLLHDQTIKFCAAIGSIRAKDLPSGFVDLDEVLRLIFARWRQCVEEWEVQLKVMFDKHRSFFEEDEGEPDLLKVDESEATESAIHLLEQEGFQVLIGELQAEAGAGQAVSAGFIDMLWEDAIADANAAKIAQVNTLWKSATDKQSGRKFYFNIEAHMTRWDDPLDDVKNASITAIPFDVLFRLGMSRSLLLQREVNRGERQAATKKISTTFSKRIAEKKRTGVPLTGK
jgi:hypothetical protein